MANFNFVIDCNDETEAAALQGFIQGLDFYQQDLEVEGEQVVLVSKQALLTEIQRWSAQQETDISVEVYPEDMDFDEAEDEDKVNFYSYNSGEQGHNRE